MISDTSFTQTLDDDGEYSLDDEEEEQEAPTDGNTTAGLLASARSSVNLPAITTTTRPTQKRSTPTPTLAQNDPKKRRKTPVTITGSKKVSNPTPRSVPGKSAVNFLNSDKWDKSVRPPFS